MSAAKTRSRSKRQPASADRIVVAPAPAPVAEPVVVAAATNVVATESVTTFRLEPSLQIKDVEAAHQRLMASFSGAVVTLDIASIQTIDTAGVQLLLATQAEAARRGIALEFAGESPAVSQALIVLGLEGRLKAAPGRV